MVATNLNPRQHLAVAGTAVLGTTLAAGLITVLDPAIAASTAPHPTLTGSLTDWLAITIENLRVLAAPFLLWLLDAHNSRLGRRAGDAVVVVVIAVNSIPVGVALGRWQGRLVPFLPQLPIEWAALIVAVSAWLAIRTTTATRHQVATLAGATAMLMLVGASLETWGTPHRPARALASRAWVDTFHRRPLLVEARGLTAPRIMRRLGRVAARSRAPFPSHRSVPLGRKPALTGLHQPPPDPHKEGPPHEHRHPHRPPHHRPRTADHHQRLGRQPPARCPAAAQGRRRPGR